MTARRMAGVAMAAGMARAMAAGEVAAGDCSRRCMYACRMCASMPQYPHGCRVGGRWNPRSCKCWWWRSRGTGTCTWRQCTVVETAVVAMAGAVAEERAPADRAAVAREVVAAGGAAATATAVGVVAATAVAASEAVN